MEKIFCKACHRQLTKKILAEKIRKKVANAIASRLKAEANGKKFQRKRSVDYAVIRARHSAGDSPAFLAGLFAINVSTVYKILKSEPKK